MKSGEREGERLSQERKSFKIMKEEGIFIHLEQTT